MSNALDCYQVSGILRIHPRKVYELLQQGKLCGKKVGRAWRVPEESLSRFLSGDTADTEKVKVEK